MRPNDTTTTLQLRWLRLKRHLRSTRTSARALRDAARVMNGEPLAVRRSLCGGSDGEAPRLAA
jgi:hypothetical protein